jgi:prepilin-type N-terminal cleavage/methylation domain-containing protein
MKKGFTLLELLIVIGILAILSTTMILVINPAELLKKARDSTRISDLSTLKTAIAIYLTDVASPSIGNTATSYNNVSTLVNCTSFATPATSTTQLVDGTGWIPINFTSISGGSPIPSLPLDPNPTLYSADPGRYYVYLVSANSTFELVANMESAYYSSGATGDVESKDGGKITGLYEVGTNLALTASAANCFGITP